MTYYYLQGGQRQKDGTIRWGNSLSTARDVTITLYSDKAKAMELCAYLDGLQQRAMARSGTPNGEPFEELRRVVAVNVEEVRENE